MANEDIDRGGRGQRDPRDQQADGADSTDDVSDAVRPEQTEPRRGLTGRGFDAGTGYGGGGNTSAYSGESSYGGQAGYGGNTMRGAYDGGEYGRPEGTKAPDDLDDLSNGERGRGAKGGLEE